ncbi:ribonuclease inhibitor-like [Aquarana catesbeiana]|uniref:ribonuclease inhibitor-like n=1 Tax=Aquarana catesbeiana TaxID=8400 RepID=UPI003CC947F0
MGRTALLKVPEDLPQFCGALGIPLIEVPNWYAAFRRTVARKAAPVEEPMEAQETSLMSNHLTDSSCTHLASGIRNNRTLRTLDLSRNNLEGPHFRDLMDALTTSRIDHLLLMSNHLTDNSCHHLASGIGNNKTLRTLNLSGNNLEGPHFRDLMEAMTTSRIEELLLSHNHLTDSSCPHLASGIRNIQTLRTLILSGNNLEGPHFKDLMEALTTIQIEELQIVNKNLSREEKRELKKLGKLRPGLKISL